MAAVSLAMLEGDCDTFEKFPQPGKRRGGCSGAERRDRLQERVRQAQDRIVAVTMRRGNGVIFAHCFEDALRVLREWIGRGLKEGVNALTTAFRNLLKANVFERRTDPSAYVLVAI